MTDLVWKSIETAPKDCRVFIAKEGHGTEFECQYAAIPESIGYYGYLRIPDLKEMKPTHWRKKNAI